MFRNFQTKFIKVSFTYLSRLDVEKDFFFLTLSRSFLTFYVHQ